MAFTGRPEEFIDTTVENLDNFYPAFSLGDFQKVYRVPTDRAQEAIEHELNVACIEVNAQLEEQQERWFSAGHTSLAEAATADSEPYEFHYLSAVYLSAKAELLDDFENFSRRDTSSTIEQDSDDNYQRLKSQSTKRIKRLLGVKTNITVEIL